MNNRWYDKCDKTEVVLDKLKKLDENSQMLISKEIIRIASSIKEIKREKEEIPVSIGLSRVLGLYQKDKKRRWYDKNPQLSSAIATISTLSDDESLGIFEALSLSLVE